MNTSQNAMYQGPTTSCVSSMGDLGSAAYPDPWANPELEFRRGCPPVRLASF